MVVLPVVVEVVIVVLVAAVVEVVVVIAVVVVIVAARLAQSATCNGSESKVVQHVDTVDGVKDCGPVAWR